MTSKKSMIRIGILSLGCPKTLVDSENILGQLSKKQYTLAKTITDCDIAILNTCAFIREAKEESIDRILQLLELKKQNRIKAVIVLGCLPQRYPRELQNELQEVDAFLGSGNYNELPQILSEIIHGRKMVSIRQAGYLAHVGDKRIRLTPRHYRYLKISEGCDHRCSFCTIPAFRGRHRSRPIADIVGEARRLVHDGAKELIITGQDTSHYGHDLCGRFLLPELLQALNQVEGVEWLRLLYTHPACIAPKLPDVMQQSSKVCHYLDMPLQHINPRILTAMRRGSSREQITKLIRQFRRRIPDLIIRTTFIVGFPGESESEFRELLDFMKEFHFERLGIFTYSREEGTPAAALPGQIPEKVKHERLDRAMALQQKISNENNRKFVGHKLRVMIDERLQGKRGIWIARGYMDAPEVDGNVFVESQKPLKIGEFYTATIKSTKAYDLAGTV